MGTNGKYKGRDDFYENLRFAILERAVEDYKQAIKEHDMPAIKELKRFFASDWCDTLLGDIDGLGKKIQRLVEEKVEKGEIKNDDAHNDLRRSIERIKAANPRNTKRKRKKYLR